MSGAHSLDKPWPACRTSSLWRGWRFAGAGAADARGEDGMPVGGGHDGVGRWNAAARLRGGPGRAGPAGGERGSTCCQRREVAPAFELKGAIRDLHIVVGKAGGVGYLRHPRVRA